MSLKKIFTESYTGRTEFPKDFKCPKPEDIGEGIWYAFTFNPKEQPFNFMVHSNIVNFYDELKEIMLKMRGCEIKMSPELSVRQRLHFHGYIKITSKMLFYFHDLTFLNNGGNLDIEHLTDPLTWDLYIHKNRDMVSEWMQFVNVGHLNYYQIDSVELQKKAI